jgi:tetraacyldisaccharide 4'-kinase
LTVLAAPLGMIYGRAMRVRDALYASGKLRRMRAPVPVVSVGNLTLGGTGKTPVVEYVARMLAEAGRRPAIVSRGYKRATPQRDFVLVGDGSRILVSAEQGGDEPLLLAHELPGIPVAVCADRHFAATRLAADGMCDCIVLDDGFQHLRLARDVDIVLVDASVELGNLRVFPAGTLREPVEALRRASCVVHTRAESGRFLAANEAFVAAIAPGIPSFRAAFTPSGLRTPEGKSEPADAMKGRRVLAFAGIAAPHLFFDTLRGLGAEVVEFPLPDHASYNTDSFARLCLRATETHCDMLLTTGKDAVKLAPISGNCHPPLRVLTRQVTIEPPPDFRDLVLARVSGA